MRVLPAIVLIFLLSSTYGLPHSYGHTVNNQYSTIVMGNQTIGGMGYNSIFYSAGNITTSNDSSVIFLNTNIIFQAVSGMSSFNINGNLTLLHSSITTDGSILEFNDTSLYGNSLTFNDSRLNFSGSFLVSGKHIAIMNTSFTHSYESIPMKTSFFNDTGNITLSSLNVTEASSPSFISVYTLSQNGQPISISGRYEYSGNQLNPFIPFIDSESIKINYTLGNLTGSIGISVGNSSSGYVNRSVVLNGSSTCINLQYVSNQFFNSGSYSISGPVPVNITVPYGENITVWKSSIVFRSNDSLYLNGSGHNFIIFDHSRMNIISDSLISNNLSQYSMNGILNPLKRGVILEGKSSLNFISTAFYSVNSGFMPIISSRNSSFFIYSEVLQRIRSNPSYVVISNAKPFPLLSQTFTDAINMPAMEGQANNLIGQLLGSGNKNSTAMVEFKINNSSANECIADFILPYDSWKFYFSLNPNGIFSGKRCVENYSVNVSMLSLNLHSFAHNTSLEVSAALINQYDKSSNITMNLSIRADSYSAEYMFKVSELTSNSMEWYNHTFTFPTVQNTTSAIIIWSLQYNNSLNIEKMVGSQNITIPGVMNEFSLEAINISMSKGWIAYADGASFHSSTPIMNIFLPVNIAQIYVPDQRMYSSNIHYMDEYPGSINNITFSKIVANIRIEISGLSHLNNTSLAIGNLIVYHVNGSLNFPLPMGNYTLSIYSGNSQLYTTTVFIHEINQSMVISVPPRAIPENMPKTILNEFYPLILGGVAGVIFGILIRARYLIICPFCLSEVGFVHFKHRCSYKKS